MAKPLTSNDTLSHIRKWNQLKGGREVKRSTDKLHALLCQSSEESTGERAWLEH